MSEILYKSLHYFSCFQAFFPLVTVYQDTEYSHFVKSFNFSLAHVRFNRFPIKCLHAPSTWHSQSPDPPPTSPDANPNTPATTESTPTLCATDPNHSRHPTHPKNTRTHSIHADGGKTGVVLHSLLASVPRLNIGFSVLRYVRRCFA